MGHGQLIFPGTSPAAVPLGLNPNGVPFYFEPFYSKP